VSYSVDVPLQSIPISAIPSVRDIVIGGKHAQTYEGGGRQDGRLEQGIANELSSKKDLNR
jgi:hypothetical protein